MQLAEQFSSIKLKKVSGTCDRSAPRVAGKQEAASLVEQFNVARAVNLENWYPLLREHTFTTEFMDISMDEAKVLIREFERKRGKNEHEPEKEDDSVLQSIERKIDEKMASFKAGGAFVRLSSRSPKDAVINDQRTLVKWKEELAKQGPAAQINENARLVALIKASTMALKVHSGHEALGLLTVSDRSNEDLVAALDFPQLWDMKVIVRQWVDLHPAMEFRGFVCKKKLTALSQYFHIAYFASLALHKAALEQRIREYFENHIVGLIPLDDYIIDFGITTPGGDDYVDSGEADSTILVIELNPLSTGSDSALFSWKTDQKVIQGQAPFEFRLRMEEVDVKPLIIVQWRNLIAIN